MVTMQWIPVEQVLEEWDDEAEAMMSRRFHRPAEPRPRPPAPAPKEREGGSVDAVHRHAAH